jgi:hypothetical protein
MLQPGDAMPNVTVWSGVHQPVQLFELVAERPLLLLFYLFDWSET